MALDCVEQQGLETAVLSVSQLNRHIRCWLEQEIGLVCVEGEISNLSKPSSGHFYFTLKDKEAQIRCVYFKNRHTALCKTLQNGQQILVQGRLSLYEARGDYQLIIEQLSEAGLGNLHQQFELLKSKLSALGLFESTRKKPLPRFPKTIGVITSPNAAALQDILTTLARRFPLATVLVYACDVQGKFAAGQLTHAVRQANTQSRCDVLIIARGGGSIEDLWAFNDEQLAHAIAGSHIPIVSGIGHETDFTIADFVADVRAPTPTAAAETVSPDKMDLMAYFNALQARLAAAVARYLQHKKWLLHHHQQKISSPERLIATHSQSLDYLEHRLQQAIKQLHQTYLHRLNVLMTTLNAKHPRVLLRQSKMTVMNMELALFRSIGVKFDLLKQQLNQQMVTLHAVSPLATLDRGYALVSKNGQLIRDVRQVTAGDKVNVRLATGSLTCEIIE